MRRPAPTLPLPGLTLLAAAILSPPPAAHADDAADRARRAVAAGEYVPLEAIVEDARSRYPGLIVEVELDGDAYEIEILDPDGAKIELEYDARTGTLLDVDGAR
jgi:uncharacterized membrane protein YkoI